MSRFNKPGVRAVGSAPVTSVSSTPDTTTHEGAPGFTRDHKSELFLLAVSNMVGQTSFYESASDRDSRFRILLRELAVSDPKWTAGLLRWLRNDANLRTAAVLGAAEFVHARREADEHGFNRQVVDSVLQRADEPGELLGYWIQTYGREVPMSVKRGLIDAIRRLYNEYSLLKHDTASHGLRFGHVIELAHPRPRNDSENALYRFAVARRYDRRADVPDELTMVRHNATLRTSADVNPNAMLNSENLRKAGMTWEDALSLVGSKVPKADLWSALVPTMGYMALLRNLRNFDESGVSDKVARQVAVTLADSAYVIKSRQFPLRFLNAYRSAPSLRWAWPLELALNASLRNVPALPGRTLVLVDRSGSMFSSYSAKSDADFADTAAVFGTALALRAESADLVEFGTDSAPVEFNDAESVLKIVGRFRNLGGTYTSEAVRRHYHGHDRVVILTDEQAHGSYWRVSSEPGHRVPANVPMYTWNLAGYRAGHAMSGRNRHTFGGLNDAAFRMIPLIEKGRKADWPWLEG
jgi:hypothetical protein